MNFNKYKNKIKKNMIIFKKN